MPGTKPGLHDFLVMAGSGSESISTRPSARLSLLQEVSPTPEDLLIVLRVPIAPSMFISTVYNKNDDYHIVEPLHALSSHPHVPLQH